MIDDARLKAACADAYSSPALHWLVGDVLHPGGAALTDRLARSLGVGPGDTVLDVACGRGASAIALAATYGCDVVGVDLSPDAIADARRRAADAGLAARVIFLEGDAEDLPVPDASADGALSECALCLMGDKSRAARELARALRPGSRLALADVTADPGALPADLRTLEARIACMAGAQPLHETVALLEGVGFAVDELESHPEALLELVSTVGEQLRAIRLLTGRLPSRVEDGVDRGLRLLRSAEAAVDAGSLGYAAVYATRR